MSRHRAPVVLLLALVLALAGCGIPTDDEPRPLADDTTTTPADPQPEAGDTTATVYLVNPDQLLEPRERALEGEESPESVLSALLLSTTPEEQAADLQSLVPPLTTVVDVVDEGDGTLAVDLSAEWGTLAAPNDLLAYGQVVLTLTEMPGVERVRFLVEGDPVDAPPTANQEPSATVTAEDYATVRAA